MTTIYTYSKARQNLASLLETAERDGEVQIRRRDGRMYVLKPVTADRSPLDVDTVQTDISTNEIVAFVRESRERGT